MFGKRPCLVEIAGLHDPEDMRLRMLPGVSGRFVTPRSVQPQQLQRRTFLRGAFQGLGVTVGLPLLDIMLNNNGTALAQGGALPMRFGVFYWGGGTSVKHWVPNGTGTNWTAPLCLEPFNAIKPYVTVVTGCNHEHTDPGHIPARGIALSSSHDPTYIEHQIASGYRGQNMSEPSLDVIVSDAWKGQTKFDGLYVGISRKGPYASNSSWRAGGTTYNRHEPSPTSIYNRIFAGFTPAAPGTPPPPLVQTTTAFERSMLDAVMADARSLNTKLGATDRQRMETHLEGLRSLETKLQAREMMPDSSTVPPVTGGSCTPGAVPPTKNFGDGGTHEEKEEKSKLMSDIVAAAFACDLTRVFSYEWSAAQSQTFYWEVGSNEEHHEWNHRDRGEGVEYARSIQFIMKNFAYLAQKLKDTPEAGGNVLDRTLIFGTSEHSTAGAHDWRDHPMLLVGKAGGKIRSGTHYRGSKGDTAPEAPSVMLTAVRAVGVNVPKLGQAPRRQTSTTVSALQA